MITARTRTLCLVIFCGFVANVLPFDESDFLLSKLTFIDLELIDRCEELASARKAALLEKNFTSQISAEESYASYIRNQSNDLKSYSEIPDDVNRNWTYLVKPGDVLLPDNEWNKLTTYKNKLEETTSLAKVPCLSNTEDCIIAKEDFQKNLRYSRDVDILKHSWRSWQTIFNESDMVTYPGVLNFAKHAAELNEKEDVKSYWEFLNDYEGAYETADIFWEEIQPLYTKFHEFVKARLVKYYKLDPNITNIPVYLLGSDFGTDWSYISDIILPHPQIHYDAESYLKYKNLKQIYKLADNVIQTMTLGALGNDFWNNSFFNISSCGPILLPFCSQKHTEMYECNNSSWVSYLDAHETAVKIALLNDDYESLMRQTLRYSVVDEALYMLGSLIAIENLPFHGILRSDVFASKSDDDPGKMTKLLLVALRVLPRLPYYLVADKWRLQELETPSEDLAEAWWELRKKFQGVEGVTNKELDFLGDSYMVSNIPYLSKYLGTIMAFQIMEYYQKQKQDPSQSLASEFGKDETLRILLRDRKNTEPNFILTPVYGLDEPSTSSILDYFRPLEKYFEEAPLEQAPIVTTTTTTTTTTFKPSKQAAIQNDPEIKMVLNDQPDANLTRQETTEVKKASENNFAMYLGVGLLIAVACVLVVAYGYKRMRRRRRTNNRRFET